MSDISGKTETGIDITDYIGERDSGSVKITKAIGSPGNFIYSRDKYSVKMVGKTPTIVRDDPEIMNINMASLNDMDASLAEKEAKITSVRLQIAEIISDMAKQ